MTMMKNTLVHVKDGRGLKEKMNKLTLDRKPQSQIDFENKLFKVNYLLQGLEIKNDKEDRKVQAINRRRRGLSS